jgi:transposase
MVVVMLGRRSPQRGLFDVIGLPHTVDPESFYGRMGALAHLLFSDEDLAGMYTLDNGRPSLPPSLMCGVLLLQFYDDVSDGEAVERLKFDLRWKVALGLPLDYLGFDPSSLSVFRGRLLDNGEERYAFDRFIQVGRGAGFIPDKVSLIVDTVAARGAGAVQDTYTLLRKGIRKLLRAMGYDVPGKRQGLGGRAKQLVAGYLDEDRKAEIDWSDPAERARQLGVLVRDAESALELALERVDEEGVRSAGWLLTKILGDDVVSDEHSNPQLGEGTAPDRVVSVTDPEMRHGRKSASKRFDGFKVSVATEAGSELLMDVADMAASEGDGRELLPAVARVEEHAGVEVGRVIGDGAYPSGDNLAGCANHPGHPVDLVSPLGRPDEGKVGKAAFRIDLEAGKATCPGGQEVEGRKVRDEKRRPVLKFAFDRTKCESCPLFSRCVRSKKHGRVVHTHYHESHLQAARQRQETAEFKELYRTRSAVERKLAELVEHGLRATRYVGKGKRGLQRLWTGAAVNLKRLFKLAEERGVELQGVLLATLGGSLPKAGLIAA